MIGTYHVLHLCCDVQCEVCCGATSAPGDVAERWSIGRHAVLPIEEILYTLHITKRSTSASLR